MKTKHLLTFLILFVAACNTYAMLSVGNVSVERAKELGIELRANAGGPKHAWIELEFKPEGALSKFQHVSLEIPDGDELGLGWTPLKDTRTGSGIVLVRVMGGRKFLEKVTLRIVCGEGRGDFGMDLKLKDFVDFEKLNQTENPHGSKPAEQGVGGQPATTPQVGD
jgi:hypothetical protein